MAYLAKSDYTLQIAAAHLDSILSQAAASSGLTADQVLANAENLAYAEVKAYLSTKYVIDTELALSSPGTRAFMVMKWIIAIALRNLHFTVNPRDIPEIREKAYKEAKEELEAARDGRLNPGIANKDPFYTTHLLGSEQKFISREFDLTGFQ